MRIIVVLLMLLATNATAQQKVNLVITDSLFIHENKSLKESERDLIRQLKLQALRQSGAVESIQTYEHMYRSEIDRNYFELFSSSTLSELNGVISFFELLKEEKSYNPEFDAFVLRYTATIEVLLYPDKNYEPHMIKLNGLHKSYRVGEKLKFSLKCNQPAWLYIFNLTDNGNYLIYPNAAENHRLLQPDLEVNFPINSGIEYHLQAEKYPEINRLVFVTMSEKKSMYFLDNQARFNSDELLFDWIFSTIPSKRGVVYTSFILTE